MDKPYEDKIERKFNTAQFPPRRIPKEVLSRTLEIATSPTDDFWSNKNLSCTPPINYELEVALNYSDSCHKLSMARNCILMRDWKSLAKLLTSNLIGETEVQKKAFPMFTDYASILLMVKDPELLKTLNQSMVSSTKANSTNKLKRSNSSISKDIAKKKKM